MAMNHLFVTISYFLLLTLALLATSSEASHEDSKSMTVAIEGMVYCQSCKHHGTWSLTGAQPISAAKVGIICTSHKARVSYYKSFQTDSTGYFFAQLNGLKVTDYILDHPLHSCKVKLVSSPLQNCNTLTNINYGMYGSPLRYESKELQRKDYETVIYAAGPLAFRPPQCP